jgi:UDP-N-acetylglucosamine 2-epimerase
MPEERNRIEVDRVASLLLCPDDRSADQLRHEQVPGAIEVVGDVMADVCQRLAPIARVRSRILEQLGLTPCSYAALTIHREANVAPDRLRRILEGVAAAPYRVVLPAHPRTRHVIESHEIELGATIDLIEPLGYLDFAALASQAAVIVTDSGGLQKEAYWYGVPCVTTRPSTEWTATVELGANVLVDDDPEQIRAAVVQAHPLPPDRPVLYGDGNAAQRVASRLSA